MSGPPLSLGTWGSISRKVIQTDQNGKPIKHQSQAKFRDYERPRPQRDGDRSQQNRCGHKSPQEAPGPRQGQPVRRAHRDTQGQPR
jgi:hypothetical protein